MKKDSSDSCQLILILFPDINFFETTIDENIFSKAFSFSAKLRISNLNIKDSTFQFRNILLIYKNGYMIIIIKNIILVKEKNIIKILDDPDMKILTYVVKKLADDYYNEIKYFLDTDNR